MAFPLRILALAVFINILWGGNVVAVKFGLLAVPPLWSAFVRFALASACLVAWARVTGVRLRPAASERGALLALSLVFTVQIALMNLGIERTTAAMGSILIATNPLFVAIFAHFAFAGDRLSLRSAAGLLTAFAGIVVLFWPDQRDPAALTTTRGNLIVLASACLLGARLVAAANLLRRIDQTRVVIWQMLLSLPVFAVAGATAERVDWAALDWRPVAGLAYQGVVIAAFAYMMAAWLMRRHRPSVVLSFNFLSPVFGVVFSVLLWGEVVTWHLLAGMAAVGLGLFVIARRQRPAP